MAITTDVYNQIGDKVGSVELADRVFGLGFNHDLVHQVIQAQIANARQVTAHTKDRGDVRGGGKKPWKQKGTGRARHGSRRSPIWKGGGVAFGPTKERNFTKAINVTMRRKALFMTLSSKVKDSQIAVLDGINLEQIKTKSAATIASAAPKLFTDYKSTKTKKDKILLAIPAKNKTIEQSFRNIPFVNVIEARNLNPHDVLQYKYLVIAKDALPVIENTFK